MNTKETAIKKGVPIPETCKELNWQEETMFYWIVDKNKNFVLVDFNELKQLDCPNFIPAPQMHEIATHLPQKLGYYYDETQKRVRHHIKFEEGYVVEIGIFQNKGYTVLGYDIFFSVVLNNNHFAQAYAELYLRLKNLNLLT